MYRPTFIVSYRAKDALHIETVYLGPFDTYMEAEDCLCALPPVIECEHKFIITLTPANYDADGEIEL
jgi:hypothetical protein